MKTPTSLAKIDGIDKKILRFLMEDARKPVLEIARSIGISGAAIHQRLRKLEASGLLSGSKFIVCIATKRCAQSLPNCGYI